MILRTDKTINKFEQIDRRTLKDTFVLQPEDLGMQCYLLSNTDTWLFNQKKVVKQTGWGITKVSTCFEALEKAQYLYKKRVYGGPKNRFLGYGYILKEYRGDFGAFENYIINEDSVYIPNENDFEEPDDSKPF